jgi:type III secretion system HrpE/YscL family protein
MSYLLWNRERNVGIASRRLVLRATEVPLLEDALVLRNRLEQLFDEQAQRIAAAAEEARAEARVLGHEEGWREARDELAARLAALAHDAARERARLRGDIAALALEVVRKLLGRFAGEALLAGLADTAARDMLPAPSLTLIVHPDRCDAVRERLAQAADEAPELCFEMRGDPACAPDTCRIETEHGSVDASLEAQLERLAAAWGVNREAVHQ